MSTDTTEKGLEDLIMRYMTASDGLFRGPAAAVSEPPPLAGGSGWFAGHPAAYDREYAVDVEHLFRFLMDTQPGSYAKLGIGDYRDKQWVARRKFLARLHTEIGRRGTIDLLRNGIKHGPLAFDLFYGTPSPGNVQAIKRNSANRFSITRQLH
ncbi:hypothetical protein [uncultured Thiodictyon sp.]|uniref:hypothetical protein n=1 Tax=uncultured Thiodictyon sp. TaxID=1846217 RepID=UPI0025DF35FB|nr:hypothetical protein [uncultured Thiodictyon sp.]